jgi:hypothetical protein
MHVVDWVSRLCTKSREATLGAPAAGRHARRSRAQDRDVIGEPAARQPASGRRSQGRRLSVPSRVSCLAIVIACLAAPAAAVEIDVGYVEALPGDTALIDVVLHTDGLEVTGIQNDIGFDREAAIAARTDGKPDCQVNPTIDKAATTFVFHPSGCGLSPCKSIRALVFALDNISPIADGAVLYTCRLAVAAGVPAAAHFLPCSNAGASDPEGNALAITCRDGEVLLPDGSPRPTLTATPTATATPTLTPLPTRDPRTPQPSPTATSESVPGELPGNPTGAQNSSRGSCAIVGTPTSGWELLAPPFLLLRRRRRTIAPR